MATMIALPITPDRVMSFDIMPGHARAITRVDGGRWPADQML